MRARCLPRPSIVSALVCSVLALVHFPAGTATGATGPAAILSSARSARASATVSRTTSWSRFRSDAWALVIDSTSTALAARFTATRRKEPVTVTAKTVFSGSGSRTALAIAVLVRFAAFAITTFYISTSPRSQSRGSCRLTARHRCTETRPNQAMQLTASKLAVYAWGVCRRQRMLRGMHRGLAAADLVSR